MPRSLLALLVLAALGCASRLNAADPPYRVGVGKADITPDHPIRLNGFGFRLAESEGVNQKIWAKAIAIDDGANGPAVLMTVDVLGIPADVYDQLARRLREKAGLKPERLAVTATHTHTGPMLKGANPTIFGTPIPPEHQANIDKYTPVFLDKLESAALAALKDRKPATLSWAVGTVGFGMNRRAKGGPADHDLPVLFVKDPKGIVRAVYVAYACHAVTLSHNKIGGDWPGYAAVGIEDTFPGAVGLIAIGCGADQNPNSGVTGDKVDVAAAQGRQVAAEVKRLSEQFLAPVTGTLTARVKTIELPLADLPTRQQWEEKAKRMDAIGHHARVTLAKLDRGEKLPTAVPYPVQTWAFGDSLAMVHLPGEVVVDYATRLKKELDGRRLWVTAYADNAPCYIPSERVLKQGGYEGGGAMIYYDLPVPFKPGLEDKIVAAVKGQIDKTFAPRFDGQKTGGTRPLSPHQSLAAIKVRPGLAVDLIAAEPLVADPVAIAFGPDGKLWVAEMADYPTGKSGKFDPGGRIVFLEDRGGAGRFDSSTVFLDNLPFPTGVLPWRKGVLVCAAPDILYAEDTNGDGKADVVTKLYSGFGTDNYQARVNGLEYGLDGWVYGSCGLFGGAITCHKTGRVVQLGDRDFRIKPDTGELEPATGRTQQGRVRDDAGDWFGCDNSTLIRHYALDDQYLRRNPHVAAPNAAVFVPTGPEPNRLFSLKSDAQRFQLSGPPNTVTAACGLGVYRDDLLGPAFTGNAFTCEPVNLLVHRRVLKPKGVTFTGERAAGETAAEFLASTDGWFRPVQAITGPDGGLWVADMYRYLIEHPRWVPADDLAKIDPRAGAGLGRIYRVRPADLPVRRWPRLDRSDTASLVIALNSPNGWQRDMATMLLVWRNDPADQGPLEQQVQTSPRPLTRLHALAALGTSNRLRPQVIAAALADSDATVRRHAVRWAEPHLGSRSDIGDKVLTLADDPDPQVRLQVAYSLGGWDDPRAAAALAKLAKAHAADPLFSAAVASSLTAANLPAVAAAVIDPAQKTDPPAHLVRALLATAAGTDGGKALPGLLAVVAKPTDGRFRPWQLAAAAGALDAVERQGGLAKLPAEARESVGRVLAHTRSLAKSADAREADLLAAVPLLGRDPATRTEDVKRLAGLLAPSRPARVQSAAVTALGRIADPAVPPALVAAWPEASPRLRSQIAGVLFSREAWFPAAFDAIEAGKVPAGQLDAGTRRWLSTHINPTIRTRAEKVFAGGAAPDRQKVIDAYLPAVAKPGDRTRGKAVFGRVCAACHVLEGVGSAVGPDLAALANKSPQYLLAEVLDPSRNLDSRYAEYQADLTDGRVVVGVLAAETATGITLRGREGKEETILRSDLDRLRGSAKSLMPEGLEKDVSPADMADLVAYLTAAAPPAKRFPGNAPAEIAAADGRLTLPAAKASIHGEQIVFEPEFRNLGYWSGAKDHAVWAVRLDKPTAFDVYLDYACADDSAGNRLALDGGDPSLSAAVASTGGWDRYKLVKLGTVKLPAGAGRLTVRPDGPVKGALLDLRTVYLVPVGGQPPAVAGKPLPPTEAAKLLLDDSAPKDRREQAARDSAAQAAAVVRVMTADLPNDPKEEYRRIPWIWRVAIAAGRANQADALRDLLDAALPKPGEPLRDWQAVVIGGGVINGLSLEGVWPARRVAELLKDRPDLSKRWEESLKQAAAMAEAEKVPTGTRYDALRMIALRGWDAARPQLTKYLAKSAHAELQMGSVSGLSDVERPEVAGLLAKSLPDLTAGNRKLAVAALLRTADRAAALLDGIEKGSVKPEWLAAEHRTALLKHPDEAVRSRAAKVIGK